MIVWCVANQIFVLISKLCNGEAQLCCAHLDFAGTLMLSQSSPPVTRLEILSRSLSCTAQTVQK